MSTFAKLFSPPFRPKSKIKRSRIDDVGDPKPLIRPQPRALIFILPPELRLLVISLLGEKAILSLRLTCHTFYLLIESNQPAVVRSLARLTSPFYSSCSCRLYPHLKSRKAPPAQTLKDHFALAHYQRLTSRLCDVITDTMQDDLLKSQPMDYFFMNRDRFWKNTYKSLQHLLAWLTEYRAQLISGLKTQEEVDHVSITSCILGEWDPLCIWEAYSLVRIIMMAINLRLNPVVNPYADMVIQPSHPWVMLAPIISAEDIIKCLLFGGWEAMTEILRVPLDNPMDPVRKTAITNFIQSIELYAHGPKPRKLTGISPTLRPFARKTPSPTKPVTFSPLDLYSPISPPRPVLPEIFSASFPTIEPQIARIILKNIPTWQQLFLDAAEPIMYATEPMTIATETMYAHRAITRRLDVLVWDFMFQESSDERGGDGSDGDEAENVM